MSSVKQRIITVAAGAAVIALAVTMWPSSDREPVVTNAEAASPLVESGAPEAKPTPIATAPLTPMKPTGSAPAVSGTQTSRAPVYSHHTQLATFHELSRKVFPSDDDRSQTERFLHDQELLRSAGRLLLQPAADRQAEADQNDAIDLLIKALAAGDSEVARTALTDVVKDGQIENTNIALSARRQLAGLKGEVLYKWTALEPDMADQVAQWLPGPKSRQVWANVVQLQKSNLAESQEEAGSAAASH